MADRPALILASGSQSRKQMLRGAGLEFDIKPADIDEEAILQQMQQNGESHYSIVSILSMKKARHIAQQNTDAITIGSDQILVHNDNILMKSPDQNQAAEKLRTLSGGAHHLISAVTIMQGDKILFQHTDEAKLHMHKLDDAMITSYINAAGDALTSTVGAYEIEGLGAWLFEKMDGDVYTILGMPLLPLLSFLRTQGFYIS